jgi:hypothetical protein
MMVLRWLLPMVACCQIAVICAGLAHKMYLQRSDKLLPSESSHVTTNTDQSPPTPSHTINENPAYVGWLKAVQSTCSQGTGERSFANVYPAAYRLGKFLSRVAEHQGWKPL